jgi:putative protease
MLPHLKRFIDSGVTSLKIEGRMKSIHYVATVTKVYREAVDIIEAGGDLEVALPRLMAELDGIGERDYTTGFYLDENDINMQQYEPFNVQKNIKFVGKVLEVQDDSILIEQRNKFVLGDYLEVLLPYGDNLNIKIEKIVNEQGENVESAPHPKEILKINKIPGVVPGSLLRIRS